MVYANLTVNICNSSFSFLFNFASTMEKNQPALGLEFNYQSCTSLFKHLCFSFIRKPHFTKVYMYICCFVLQSLKREMSSSNSSCAACKFRRQKCTQECMFAPYFPPDHLPQKFSNVHNVFGATTNVAELLNQLSVMTPISLAYKADFRLRDPIFTMLEKN